jgi:hypothetical protein
MRSFVLISYLFLVRVRQHAVKPVAFEIWMLRLALAIPDTQAYSSPIAALPTASIGH